MTLGRPLAILLSVAGAAALAYSCSSKGSTNPPPTYTISRFSVDSQVGAAGAPLGATLVVYVKDQNNASASGVTVNWSVGTGGGSVASGTSLTDLDGHAQISRTLGPAAGFQTTVASLSGATGSPVTFTSISQIQGAFTIAAGTGGGQSDTVLATLASPFQATVTDHTGAPVAGVVVSFAATAGGGMLSQSADTSDASGHVTSTLTLPAAVGGQTVQASVTGLLGSPVSFGATATAGHAATLTKGTGDAQAAFRTTALPNPHTVIVKDSHGNVVSGFTVHWVAGTGGGSMSDTVPVSGANGVASSVRILGDSTGIQTDTARAALTGSPVTFTSTSNAPPMTAGITVGQGISYSQASVTVAVGGTVTWTWAAGSLSHSVQFLTAPDTLPTASAVMTTGTFHVTFTKAGTYTYDCAIHGTAMQGTVIVL